MTYFMTNETQKSSVIIITSTIIDYLFNLNHKSTFRLRIAPGKYISRQFIIFKYRILRSFKYNASLFEDFKDRK